MNSHPILQACLLAATFAASTGAIAADWVAASVDPQDFILSAGAGSSLIWIGWKVWADSRSTELAHKTQADQIETLTTDRDFYRKRTENLEKLLQDALIKLAQRE